MGGAGADAPGLPAAALVAAGAAGGRILRIVAVGGVRGEPRAQPVVGLRTHAGVGGPGPLGRTRGGAGFGPAHPPGMAGGAQGEPRGGHGDGVHRHRPRLGHRGAVFRGVSGDQPDAVRGPVGQSRLPQHLHAGQPGVGGRVRGPGVGDGRPARQSRRPARRRAPLGNGCGTAFRRGRARGVGRRVRRVDCRGRLRGTRLRLALPGAWPACRGGPVRGACHRVHGARRALRRRRAHRHHRARPRRRHVAGRRDPAVCRGGAPAAPERAEPPRGLGSGAGRVRRTAPARLGPRQLRHRVRAVRHRLRGHRRAARPGAQRDDRSRRCHRCGRARRLARAVGRGAGGAGAWRARSAAAGSAR